MGYGLGLSKAAKIAIARGATLAGTATNTGEGPVLEEEREEARKLVVQYTGVTGWTSDGFSTPDMVEIHLGQGASASGAASAPEKTSPASKVRMGLRRDQKAYIRSTFPELERGEPLSTWWSGPGTFGRLPWR